MDNIKYLGVKITNDLKWNTHISNICTKANRTLGFLRRTLFSCPQNVKEAAYKGMVRPILEYGSSVWDPHPDSFKKNWKRFKIVQQGLWPEIMIMKLGAWLAFSDNWNGNPLRKGERIIDSYCYTKVWKVKPRYLLMTLFPRLGVAGISTLWPFRYPQPVKLPPDYQGLEWPPWIPDFFLWTVRW